MGIEGQGKGIIEEKQRREERGDRREERERERRSGEGGWRQ
jgi:hypothetical protein